MLLMKEETASSLDMGIAKSTEMIGLATKLSSRRLKAVLLA